MEFGITNEPTIYLISKDDLSKLSSIKDAKKFDKNPFILELHLETTPTYKKEQSFQEGGDNYLIAREVGRRDRSKFIRLFDFDELDLKELKGNAAKILLYILYSKTNYDVSVFHLPSAEITEEVGITNITSINGALIDLIKLKYIAKQTENNWYWINPNRFYKGDRKRIDV